MARQHGTERACLSASAPLPQRPQQGSRGARARGASTNELHSFPHFSIWWPFVLGRRGRNDAICWHVLSFSQTVQPTKAPASRRQARAACCFTRYTHMLLVCDLLLIQRWKQHPQNTIKTYVVIWKHIFYRELIKREGNMKINQFKASVFVSILVFHVPTIAYPYL